MVRAKIQGEPAATTDKRLALSTWAITVQDITQQPGRVGEQEHSVRQSLWVTQAEERHICTTGTMEVDGKGPRPHAPLCVFTEA